MVLKATTWTLSRLRPVEGWLPLLLLAGAVSCLVVAVLQAGWTPQDSVVVPTAVLGLLLGVLIAKRPLRPAAAWLLIVLYGLLITTIHLARLWPPLVVLLDEQNSLTQYWRQSGALFLDRIGSWLTAVLRGGRSEETIVFAFGLGLAAWLLAACAGWSTFRRRKPLAGLSVMGLAITVNSYYGGVNPIWAAAFIMLAAVIAAIINYADLEQTWQQQQVDYSDEIRQELSLYAAILAACLLAVALALPGIPYTEMARRLAAQPAVQEVEETLGRVFAGVRPPERGDVGDIGRGGGTGLLPRAYLLGSPPELSERIMMTAVVSIVQPDGATTPATNADLRGAHWRGLSYDVYTGRGWALSDERRETLLANQFISLPDAAEQTTILQQVEWVFDDRLIRYTLGMPEQFNQPVTVYWRGLSDLSRVQATESVNTFQARTRLAVATPALLRQTAVADAPPAILARYTALPASVPQRVQELAQDVAGALDNPYDQARALERFLRQYPYSLDVDLPPPNADPVDYFLFDLQIGYCDYYASAMTVMARSLGLPARMTVGFLNQPIDENGRQTIRQINAHSWSEIYFAGYGWIEFEPTAPFSSLHDAPPAAVDLANPDAAPTPPAGDAPPAIPTPDSAAGQRQWLWLLPPAGALLLLWWLWQRRRPSAVIDAVWVYGRWQQQARRLGMPAATGQTPHEFAAAFLARLDAFSRQRSWTRMATRLHTPLMQLTDLFARQQYSPHKPSPETARRLWASLKRPLQQLRLLAWIIRRLPPPKKP